MTMQGGQCGSRQTVSGCTAVIQKRDHGDLDQGDGSGDGEKQMDLREIQEGEIYRT